MTSIGSSNISFSGLKANYVAGTQTGAEGNSDLRDGSTTSAISLSDFRGTKLSLAGSGGTTTEIDSGSDEEISIDDDLKGKTILIPVTGVTLSITDTTPNESTTVSDYATAVVSPSSANGTLTIEFTTASKSGASGTPASTGYQSGSAGTTKMNYTFSAVTSNTAINNITVNVKQNGGSVIATVNSSSITIQETGGGGGGCG